MLRASCAGSSVFTLHQKYCDTPCKGYAVTDGPSAIGFGVMVIVMMPLAAISMVILVVGCCGEVIATVDDGGR